jgi:protein-tyrosine-phosphatase
MTPDELRSAQKLTMANPERLRLLARMLTHPAGRCAAEDLVPRPAVNDRLGEIWVGEAQHGVGAALTVADVEQDLEALVAVGLVAVVGPTPSGAQSGRSQSDRPLSDRPLSDRPLSDRSHTEGSHSDRSLAGRARSNATLYRVSSRGIARFGAAALAAPRHAGEAALDVHNHDALLARLTETLAAGFAANAGAGTVDRLVRECYSALSKQTGSFGQLPALTAWLATDRLAAMAEVTHGSPRDVLFVCVHNTGRSQIAAAVTRRLAGDRIRVRTAGTRPVAEPDSMTETVLARRGLDGLIEFPRQLTDDVVRASGVIVTMGCGDACPVYPGRRYLDWPLDDPAGRPIEEVEKIVDDITARVRALIAEIDAVGEPSRSGLSEERISDNGPLPAWLPRGCLPRMARRPWTAMASALGAKGQRKAR